MYGANEPIANLAVRKSNDFIAAKYKSTLLENQVMAIALTRIEVNAKDKDSPLEAKLYPGELKRLVSDEAHIYRDLKKLSKTIVGHTMFIEDGKGNFKAFSIVPNAEYVDGVFTVKFNNELKQHILDLKENYTTLQLSILTDFTRDSTYRLYEVLKKEAYKIPKGENSYTEVEYNINELRFTIGMANSDDETVKKMMANMGAHVDWDLLFEKLDRKDKKYVEWRDFQRKVIKTAQEEMKEKSDIRFEYEGITEGRKTKRILFRIYHNIPTNVSKINERKDMIARMSKPERQYELPYDTNLDLYDKYVGHNNLSKEDLDVLFIHTSDKQLICDAIEAADRQVNVKNYMGWIIAYIDAGGYTLTEVLNGSAEDAVKVKNIMEEYERDKKSGNIHERLLAKTKKKDDYPAFEQMITSNGVSIEQLEVLYSAEEIVQMYADWKCNRPIQF